MIKSIVCHSQIYPLSSKPVKFANLKLLYDYLSDNKSYTAKWIWDSSIFFLLNQNLTYDCCWFLCFYLNLPDLNLKLFWTSKQNNFRFWSGKFSQIQVKTQKSTNNPMSSFGLIEKIWSCLIFMKLYVLTTYLYLSIFCLCCKFIKYICTYVSVPFYIIFFTY